VFKHHCSACDRTQLIFPSQVSSVASGADGAIATFTCWCGAEQSSSYSLMSAVPAPVSPVPQSV
jgi:hypothetical protein